MPVNLFVIRKFHTLTRRFWTRFFRLFLIELHVSVTKDSVRNAYRCFVLNTAINFPLLLTYCRKWKLSRASFTSLLRPRFLPMVYLFLKTIVIPRFLGVCALSVFPLSEPNELSTLAYRWWQCDVCTEGLANDVPSIFKDIPCIFHHLDPIYDLLAHKSGNN